jgi:exonuclease III
MSFNISNASFGYDKNKKTREIKKEGLIDFLDQFKNTDILCFQEVGDYAYEILKKNFPKHHIYFKQKGAVILSKYRFSEIKEKLTSEQKPIHAFGLTSHWMKKHSGYIVSIFSPIK